MLRGENTYTHSLLQGLNQAAATLQRQASVSRQTVFEAFRTQLLALELVGAVIAYDPSSNRLNLEAVVLPATLDRHLQAAANRLGVNMARIGVDAAAVPALAEAVHTRTTRYSPDNAATTVAMVPSVLQPLIKPLLRFQAATPGIVAPIIRADACWGLLGISGAHLRPEDISTVSAFANHLAVALDNADLVTELKRIRQRVGENGAGEDRPVAANPAASLRYQALFQQSPTVMGILSADGTLLEMNLAAYAFVGRRADGALGHSIFNQARDRVLTGEAVERLRAAAEIAAAGQTIRFEIETLRHDGAPRQMDVTVTPVMTPEGKASFLLVEARDTTEQKLALEALHVQQRIAGLARLAGGAAHDFNNLLVALLGQSTLTLHKLQPKHPAYPHVEKIVAAAEQAGRLTRQLQAYAGNGEFALCYVNLNDLVRERVAAWNRTPAPAIFLVRDLADHLPGVMADREAIGHVLDALLANAREAIEPEGGQITVRTGLTEVSFDLQEQWLQTHNALFPGQYVFLEIGDTGSGMDRSTLSQVFDPFFTTKPESTGLGLSTVLGIVRGLQGSLRIRSDIGQGTTIQLLFAAAPQPAAGELPTPVESPAEVKATLSQTVLIVDDDPVVVEAVVDILELTGLPTLTAASGEEGLAKFEAHRREIGLVLLDLGLPGMGGEETLQAFQALAPALPVLLSSGHDMRAALARLNGNRPVACVQKPYRAETLLEIVHTYLP